MYQGFEIYMRAGSSSRPEGSGMKCFSQYCCTETANRDTACSKAIFQKWREDNFTQTKAERTHLLQEILNRDLQKESQAGKKEIVEGELFNIKQLQMNLECNIINMVCLT